MLDTEPGAGVYHGFRRQVSSVEASAAALDGSIMDLLEFREMAVGELRVRASRDCARHRRRPPPLRAPAIERHHVPALRLRPRPRAPPPGGSWRRQSRPVGTRPKPRAARGRSPSRQMCSLPRRRGRWQHNRNRPRQSLESAARAVGISNHWRPHRYGGHHAPRTLRILTGGGARPLPCPALRPGTDMKAASGKALYWRTVAPHYACWPLPKRRLGGVACLDPCGTLMAVSHGLRSTDA